MMTLEQIDAELGEWERKLRMATRQHAGTARLAGLSAFDGRGHGPGSTGRDHGRPHAGRPRRPAHAVDLLFAAPRDDGRARKLRESLSPLLPSRNVLGEIEHLLHGPSIATAGRGDAAGAAGPFGRRGSGPVGRAGAACWPPCTSFSSRGAMRCWPSARPGTACRRSSAAFRGRASALAAGDGTLPTVAAAARLAAMRGQVRHRSPDRGRWLPRPWRAEIGGPARGHRPSWRPPSGSACRTTVGRPEIVRRSRPVASPGGRDGSPNASEGVLATRAPALPRPAGDEALAGAGGAGWRGLEAEVAAGRWQPVRVGIQRWNAAARQCLDADRAGPGRRRRRCSTSGAICADCSAPEGQGQANGRAEDPAAGRDGAASQRLARHAPHAAGDAATRGRRLQQRLL